VFAVAVVSTGAAWTFDVTVDDPTGTYPNPALNPGAPGGRNVTAFPSSAIPGSSQSGGSAGGVTSQLFGLNYNGLPLPIAAYRLTILSATGGTVTATVLQPGPR